MPSQSTGSAKRHKKALVAKKNDVCFEFDEDECLVQSPPPPPNLSKNRKGGTVDEPAKPPPTKMVPATQIAQSTQQQRCNKKGRKRVAPKDDNAAPQLEPELQFESAKPALKPLDVKRAPPAQSRTKSMKCDSSAPTRAVRASRKQSESEDLPSQGKDDAPATKTAIASFLMPPPPAPPSRAKVAENKPAASLDNRTKVAERDSSKSRKAPRNIMSNLPIPEALATQGTAIGSYDLEMQGENNVIVDNMWYHHAGMEPTQKLVLRQQSAIQVAKLLSETAVRSMLRAHGLSQTIILRIIESGAGEDDLLCGASLLAIARMTKDVLDKATISVQQLEFLFAVVLEPQQVVQDRKSSSQSSMRRQLDRLYSEVPELAGTLSEEAGLPLQYIALGVLQKATENNDKLMDALRLAGGFKVLNEHMESCVALLSNENGRSSALMRIIRIGCILENVTFRNSQNVEQLVSHIGIMEPVLDIIQRCQATLFAPCFELEEESARPIAVECLCSMLRVLVNLTNENNFGPQRFAALNGLQIVADMLVTFHSDKYDILVLALGLLINVLEHSKGNRQQMRKIVTGASTLSKKKAASQPTTAIQGICKLFCVTLEQSSALQQKGTAQWEAVAGLLSPRSLHDTSTSQASAVALGNALLSYAAMLLGVLSREADNLVDIQERLGDRFVEVRKVLKQFLKDQQEAEMLTEEMESSVAALMRVVCV